MTDDMTQTLQKMGRIPGLIALVANHLDACGLTLIIATLGLFIHQAIRIQTIVLVVAMTVMCWLAFAFNDYCDAPFDAHDPAKRARNFFAHYTLPGWLALPGLAVLLGFLVAVFTSFGLRGLIVLGICLAGLWAYSAPPLRLKRRPVLDLLSHALFIQTGPYFACLFLINATWNALDYVLLTIFVLSSLAAQLEQQARDYEVDSRLEMNFTTILGLKPTVGLLRGLSFALILITLINILNGTIPLYLLPFGLIGLPVVAHRFTRRLDAPRSERLVFISVVGALLYAGAIWGYVLVTETELLTLFTH